MLGTGAQAPTVLKALYEYGILGAVGFFMVLAPFWRSLRRLPALRASVFSVYLLSAGFLLSAVWPLLILALSSGHNGTRRPAEEVGEPVS